MVQSTMVVAINRPIEQVFAFVADAETAPQWQTAIVEIRRTTTGLIGLGATFEALRSQLREHIASIVEIVEYEPHRRVTFESVWEMTRYRDSYIFQSVGGSTRVTYEFDLAGRARGARQVFSREAADLSKLKAVLEAQRGPVWPASAAPRPALAAADRRSFHIDARPEYGG